jgi:hypothetical protein
MSPALHYAFGSRSGGLLDVLCRVGRDRLARIEM